MKNLLIICVLLLGFTSCKTPEARKPVTVKSGSFIDESVERNKALHQQQKELFENIMKKSPETDYITSANGFWYYYNTKNKDSLYSPKFGDIVNFNYIIKDLNGNVIYSEAEQRIENYAMDQQELFSGLREGLKLMKTGETVTFLFPSQKAFGYYGDTNKIGTNIPIICEATINSIKKNESN